MNNLTNQTGLEKMAAFIKSKEVGDISDTYDQGWCAALSHCEAEVNSLIAMEAKSSVGKDAVEVGDMGTADVTIEGKICGILPFKKTLGNVPVKVTHVVPTSQDGGLSEIEVLKKQLAFCKKRYRAVVDELSKHPAPQDGLREFIAWAEHYDWGNRDFLSKAREIESRHPLPVSSEALKANAEWPLREKIGGYIDGLRWDGDNDTADDLNKILEETGHTVYPPMRGTVKEESLAELADRKGFWIHGILPGKVKYRNDNNSPVRYPWSIGMHCEATHTNTAYYGDTYAEAEAKARQFLLGLDDSKGGGEGL